MWDELADDASIERTVTALKSRGFDVIVVNNGEEAKAKVLELIPKGAEVTHVASETLREIGVSEAINDSGEFESWSTRIRAVNDDAERAKLRKMAMSPDYGIGSVHAITENGEILDASASGSQIPVYSYGATHLILVAGTQKIVKNLDDGFTRIREYVFQLENERVKEVYKMPGSSLNMILVLEKQRPGRTTVVLVKEKLGF